MIAPHVTSARISAWNNNLGVLLNESFAESIDLGCFNSHTVAYKSIHLVLGTGALKDS